MVSGSGTICDFGTQVCFVIAPSNGGADELDLRAKIAMPREAPFALAARPVRIDGDERAALQAEFGDVLAESAAELVSRNEWSADLG